MSRSAWTGRSASGAINWLGLVWVWSGGLWLLGLLLMAAMGQPGGVLAFAVRLAVSLAVGVGLCALERWAWAAVVCVSAFYTAISASVAVAAGSTLVTLPSGTLSWMPVFLGMNVDRCLFVASAAVVVAVLSGWSLHLLWRDQAEFGVPYRRPFTVLLHDGAWQALPVALADAYLLYGWWRLQVG